MIRTRFPLLLLLLAVSVPAQAATLTLEQALAQAEVANPGLGAGAARVSVAQLTADAAARQGGFRLRAEADGGLTDQPSHAFAAKLDAGEFTNADFAIDSLNHPDVLAQALGAVVAERPLDVFHKVQAAATERDQLAQAAAADLAESRLDLRLAVVETYRRILVAERTVAVAEGALEASRSRERELAEQVDQGLALPADTLRARARRREHEANVAARRSDAQVARASLARWLGMPLADDVALVTPPEGPPADGDEAAWQTQALSGRPLLQAAQARVAAARWQTTGEQRGTKPDLALWARAQLQHVDFAGGRFTGGAGVSLRWSLIDPGRHERLAAVAAAERGAALDLQAMTERIRFEVTAALNRLRAAREQVRAAAGGTEEGREVLRVTQERRRAGLATLTDELEAESVALAAEKRELEATHEVALAEAALQRAVGAL